jgi:hypothetical protein
MSLFRYINFVGSRGSTSADDTTADYTQESGKHSLWKLVPPHHKILP